MPRLWLWWHGRHGPVVLRRTYVAVAPSVGPWIRANTGPEYYSCTCRRTREKGAS